MPPLRTPAPSNFLDEGRFPAGTVLVNRDRIIGLVGRGGMGEVYSRQRLKLGQPVALKFLPATTVKNQQSVDRFHAEVRIARRVSHPNVCRVYDIGEVDTTTFLSMEYVDGEDLRSLPVRDTASRRRNSPTMRARRLTERVTARQYLRYAFAARRGTG